MNSNNLPFCAARNARIDAAGDYRPRDTLAHSSVQPWSAGPLFPAVIAVIERYCSTLGALTCQGKRGGECWQKQRCMMPARSYELTIGAYREEFATREDAELVARHVCQNGRIIPERYAELMKGRT